MPNSPRLPRLRPALAAPLAAVLALDALGAQPVARSGHPPRLSLELATFGARMPDALAENDGCGSVGRGGNAVGFSLGAGYRLARWLRADGRLGAFGQPGTSGFCTVAPGIDVLSAAPTPPLPAGTVQRSRLYDPELPEHRGFAQLRLVTEGHADDMVLRVGGGGGSLLGIGAPFASGAVGIGQRFRAVVLMAELERWWFSFPSVDRTTVWEARTGMTPPGLTYTVPVATDARFRRAGRATWLRVGATLPLPGT